MRSDSTHLGPLVTFFGLVPAGFIAAALILKLVAGFGAGFQRGLDLIIWGAGAIVFVSILMVLFMLPVKLRTRDTARRLKVQHAFIAMGSEIWEPLTRLLGPAPIDPPAFFTVVSFDDHLELWGSLADGQPFVSLPRASIASVAIGSHVTARTRFAAIQIELGGGVVVPLIAYDDSLLNPLPMGRKRLNRLAASVGLVAGGTVGDARK